MIIIDIGDKLRHEVRLVYLAAGENVKIRKIPTAGPLLHEHLWTSVGVTHEQDRRREPDVVLPDRLHVSASESELISH